MTFSGQRLAQSEYELRTLIQKLRENECRSWLEVGARHGDTFYEVVTSLPKGSKAVAVDLPEAAWGKTGSQTSLEKCCDELRLLGYEVDLVLGDSTSADVIEKVKALGHFDAVLLDGDHRYDGIKSDWLNYHEIADKMVIFHDIVGEAYTHKKDPTWILQVPILWNEIKGAYRHEEIVDWSGPLMGIGIVYMDKSNESFRHNSYLESPQPSE